MSMTDWIDGGFDHEVELKLHVEWQEENEICFQVYAKGDEEHKLNIAPYLTDDERDHIETCINDILGEADGRG